MDWTDLTAAAGIAPGTNRTVAGVTIFNDGGTFHACETRCPHMGHPMAKGTIRDGVITCAWHRWDFDLAHGGCYRGGTDDLRVYPLRIADGRVWIERAALAIDLADRARRLRESLLIGDTYLQAKELARLVAAGVSAAAALAVLAEHGFRHSIGTHRNGTAALELQVLLDAAHLAAFVPADDLVQALMLGLRHVGANTGERPVIEPLPGAPAEARLAALFATYVLTPSALGLERILLTLAGDAAALERTVLAAATMPFLIDRPGVLDAVATWCEAGAVIGAEFEASRHAVLAWTLGEGRPTPDADASEAMAWLEAAAGQLADPTLGSGTRTITAETVAELLTEPRIATAFTRLLGWLTEGVAWNALLDALSLTFARRLARLQPGNGGLWGSAAEGVNLCRAVRRIGGCAGGRYRVQALFTLVFHLHRTRWLPSPAAENTRPEARDWAGYATAFAALDAKDARRHALATLAHESDRTAATGRWLTPMLHEDLDRVQLHLLSAIIEEMRHQHEWQPYLAGTIGWVLDAKNARTTQAATRFGRSFAGAPSEHPAS